MSVLGSSGWECHVNQQSLIVRTSARPMLILPRRLATAKVVSESASPRLCSSYGNRDWSGRLARRDMRIGCEAFSSEDGNESLLGSVSLSKDKELLNVSEDATCANQSIPCASRILQEVPEKSADTNTDNSESSSDDHNSIKNVGWSGGGHSMIDVSNTQWKNVFPSYMQSKDYEAEDSTQVQTISNGHDRCGANEVMAAKAAAAAAASAKEFESQFRSQLPPSAVYSSPISSYKHLSGVDKNLNALISRDPIWAAIRAEARLEAEREPLLSSFLYASILAHRCLERSLGFVLANRLKNATLLATQLLDVFDDVFVHDACVAEALRLDVQAVRDRDPSCRSYSAALLYLKGYHALQAYRVANALWKRGQEVLALALQSRISEVFAVDIHPAARIGKSILLDHGTGVVIGETAVVGDRVSMLQGVTLGGTGKVAGDRHPKIREGVLIGAGATILGNIIVGRGAMVAAGSLVLKDVPPHCMVAGTPAKVVGYLEEPAPSLTMKHDVTNDFCKELDDVDRLYVKCERLCDGAGI